jgi:ribosomal protein S6--L-glutamate ligase
VLEVNSSPGLEGIEAATGIDIAGGIIEYLERRVRRRHRAGLAGAPARPSRAGATAAATDRR